MRPAPPKLGLPLAVAIFVPTVVTCMAAVASIALTFDQWRLVSGLLCTVSGLAASGSVVAATRLIRSLEVERRFIAQAAHELRSPLTTLYGELSQAMRGRRNADGYREAIEEALESARRLKSLAEDLLLLAAEAPPPPVPADVRAIVDAVWRDLRHQAAERGVTCTFDLEDVRLVGRPRDLERMLRNLLENAVRHCAEGKTVAVRAGTRERILEISVEDEGPGIPEPERDRIFEPFYRCAHDRSTETLGAGLGLAIARGIARSHGGDVRLGASRQERGARFVVELPMSAPQGAGAAALP